MTIKTMFWAAGVYSAKQCADINDVEIAISKMKDLARSMNNHYTPAMRRRLSSLENKKQKLSLK